jgi:hypothetical protein
MSISSEPKPVSSAHIAIPDTTRATITTIVLFTTCFLDGHTTFLNSDLASLKYLTIERLGLLLPEAAAAAFATAVVLSFAIMRSSLLGFPVERVLAAESAVLVHFDSVGIVLLVFLGVVITLFAFCARERDLVSRSGHFGTSCFITVRMSG